MNPLFVLGNQLRGHGFTTGIGDDSGPLLAVVDVHKAVIVRVRPRLDDAGRLWFYAGAIPLAEADQSVNAVTAIKGLMAS